MSSLFTFPSNLRIAQRMPPKQIAGFADAVHHITPMTLCYLFLLVYTSVVLKGKLGTDSQALRSLLLGS